MNLQLTSAARYWVTFCEIETGRHRQVRKAKRPQFDNAILPRGLTRLEAAALTGLSPSAFDKARREKKYPSPTLPGGRYDRQLIEKRMNQLSGLEHDEKTSPLDAWRAKRGTGSP